MPFTTSQNPGMTQAANSIAKIFVGDPAADAKYHDQQIKNSTEMARQKMIAEQTVSEAVRRKQMEAQAAASYASANNSNASAGKTKQETRARADLGNLFITPVEIPGRPVAIPLDARAPTRGVDPGEFYGDHGPSQKVMGQPTLDDPAIAAKAAAIMLRGGIDPKNAGAMALIPGNSDEALGRIFTAGGHTIGGDQYVSVHDRNANNTTNVPTGSRMVNNDGHVVVDAALGAGGGAGGKVPKLAPNDVNNMIRSAVSVRGGKDLGQDPKTAGHIATYLAQQPELYADMTRIVAEAHRLSGGNSASVQAALQQYLDGTDFSKFGEDQRSWWNPRPQYHIPVQPKTSAEAIIQSLVGQQPGVNPNVFTGGQAPLPNLQNVGNGGGSAGGWKVIGVQKPGG